MTEPSILEVRQLTRKFGGLVAVNDMSFTIAPREIVGLIGPNGAGKTTVFNLISGIFRPTSGAIFFEGKDITGLRPDRIVARGVARTFQLSTLFNNFTVLENVIVACHLRGSEWSAFLPASSRANGKKSVLDHAEEILQFVGMDGLKNELARNLSHGFQRYLGVALAYSTNPRLLLLDEPMTGMHLEEVQMMIGLIKKLRESGATVVLVEHNMKAVMSICDRVMVVNFGKKIADGVPAEVCQNREVIEAYLGVKEAAA